MKGTTALRRAQERFRARRMALLEREFRITSRTRILDVGGLPMPWTLLEAQPRVTMLNLPGDVFRDREPGNIDWVAGDGCCLPFPDQSFDLVFSNSVIEHLGSWERQAQFAQEIARVGRSYFVQTPNRGFPVEQHLLTPFVHWLPRRWQRPIVQRVTVWEMVARPGAPEREYYIQHYLADIRLLRAGELTRLFPGARIVGERFCGVTKSLVAMKTPDPR
jgi:hypothetical protein